MSRKANNKKRMRQTKKRRQNLIATEDILEGMKKGHTGIATLALEKQNCMEDLPALPDGSVVSLDNYLEEFGQNSISAALSIRAFEKHIEGLPNKDITLYDITNMFVQYVIVNNVCEKNGVNCFKVHVGADVDRDKMQFVGGHEIVLAVTKRTLITGNEIYLISLIEESDLNMTEQECFQRIEEWRSEQDSIHMKIKGKDIYVL